MSPAVEVTRPSPLACVNCRTTHLKCDAKFPSCERCNVQGLVCKYVRSKRGLYKSRTQPYGNQQDLLPPWSVGENASDATPAFLTTAEPDPGEIRACGSASSHVAAGSILDGLNFLDASNDQFSFLKPTSQASLDILRGTRSAGDDEVILAHPGFDDQKDVFAQDRAFIDMFYTDFYPAHAFVVPGRLLQQNPSILPRQLLIAMVFAGSHYSSNTPSIGTRDNAIQLLHLSSTEDGFLVQALLLLALTFHARFEEPECLNALQKASDLALNLHMFDPGFASANSFGNPTIAESWRRTCWELIAVDILMPTFHESIYKPCLQDLKPLLALPSEELQYIFCHPRREMRTQDQFHERLFSEDKYNYSSFAYKIEAARLLYLVRSSTTSIDSNCSEPLSISLANFVLSLPASKRRVTRAREGVDEVLYSAHVIINVASLIYYRSRSNFGIAQNQQPSQCTAITAPRSMEWSSPEDTSKALQAADTLSDTIAAHLEMKKHNLFLTCAIAFSCSIHLPAYLTPEYAPERHIIKERLQLGISALQTIGEVWRIAKVVKAQISKYAREVLFHTRRSTLPNSLELDPEKIQEDSIPSDDSWLNLLSDPKLFGK